MMKETKKYVFKYTYVRCCKKCLIKWYIFLNCTRKKILIILLLKTFPRTDTAKEYNYIYEFFFLLHYVNLIYTTPLLTNLYVNHFTSSRPRGISLEFYSSLLLARRMDYVQSRVALALADGPGFWEGKKKKRVNPTYRMAGVGPHDVIQVVLDRN